MSETEKTMEAELRPHLRAVLDEAGVQIVLRVIVEWCRERAPREKITKRLAHALKEYVSR